ncbi:hypothetical protein ACH5RR_008846 [Cinchona calisaya]|uniref:FAR1 domain-containing protein n=1 Tax=Cinchona calisaya TaxID=153742 RepID=A0ABD3ACW8_9GENT
MDPTFRVFVESPLVPYLSNKVALYSLEKLIGEPLKIDAATTLVIRRSLARVFFELDLTHNRPPTIWIASSLIANILLRVAEGLPTSCAIADMDANTCMRTECSPRRRLDFDAIDQDNNDEDSSPMVLNVIKNINKIHSSILTEVIPKIGMQFETEQEAYDFYLAYAKEVGFGIKRSTHHKDKNGKLVDRVFCCSAEGKRAKDKRDIRERAHRPET